MESNVARQILTAEGDKYDRIIAVVDQVNPAAPATVAAIDSARADILGLGGIKAVADPQVAADGTAVAVTVTLAKLKGSERRAVIASATERLDRVAGEIPGASVVIGGDEPQATETNRTSAADTTRAELLGLPITLVVQQSLSSRQWILLAVCGLGGGVASLQGDRSAVEPRPTTPELALSRSSERTSGHSDGAPGTLAGMSADSPATPRHASSRTSLVEEVLSSVAAELSTTLGGELLGLYVHGSWVVGDFAPDRSDLDLLAVLGREPDETMLAGLDAAHSRLESVHPAWIGRVEVEYVALHTVRMFASAPSQADGAAIARISPGERLHLLPATVHRLLTWATVRGTGRPLVGSPARDLLPAITDDTARAAALEHVRDWPMWVQTMTRPGGQAYAVLSLCRALHLFTAGSQVSKRAAANYAAAELPEWAPLITWARDWWYAGGCDDENTRLADSTRFVNDISARILSA